MFGPFKPTSPLSSGLLWKIPWRLSSPQKRRQRKRLRLVDNVVAVVDAALQRSTTNNIINSSSAQTAKMSMMTKEKMEMKMTKMNTVRNLERWKEEMPSESEMRPKDKYTIFDRKERGYRKGIHKLPKWTKVSQRINPPGF